MRGLSLPSYGHHRRCQACDIVASRQILCKLMQLDISRMHTHAGTNILLGICPKLFGKRACEDSDDINLLMNLRKMFEYGAPLFSGVFFWSEKAMLLLTE